MPRNPYEVEVQEILARTEPFPLGVQQLGAQYAAIFRRLSKNFFGLRKPVPHLQDYPDDRPFELSGKSCEGMLEWLLAGFEAGMELRFANSFVGLVPDIDGSSKIFKHLHTELANLVPKAPTVYRWWSRNLFTSFAGGFYIWTKHDSPIDNKNWDFLTKGRLQFLKKGRVNGLLARVHVYLPEMESPGREGLACELLAQLVELSAARLAGQDLQPADAGDGKPAIKAPPSVIAVSDDGATVNLDGKNHRLNGEKDAPFLRALLAERGKAIKADVLERTIGERPARIYRRLPVQIQRLIDKPGRGQTGYILR